jgi:hypothetical protein
MDHVEAFLTAITRGTSAVGSVSMKYAAAFVASGTPEVGTVAAKMARLPFQMDERSLSKKDVISKP